jgi:hypothetical protein
MQQRLPSPAAPPRSPHGPYGAGEPWRGYKVTQSLAGTGVWLLQSTLMPPDPKGGQQGLGQEERLTMLMLAVKNVDRAR